MPELFLKLPHLRQATEYTCLPACVRMVLAYHAVEMTEEEVVELLDTDFTGTVAKNVHRVSRFGFVTAIYRATCDDLYRHLGSGLPCIVLVHTIHFPQQAPDRSGRHAVVIVGLDDESVYLHDPLAESGPTRMPLPSFHAAWQARGHPLVLLAPLQGLSG
ncbi:MAG: C39 family peptidase [Armatimonadetes bacterium]|nr:C39 family peptidase [Armatimonadota bacterium]